MRKNRTLDYRTPPVEDSNPKQQTFRLSKGPSDIGVLLAAIALFASFFVVPLLGDLLAGGLLLISGLAPIWSWWLFRVRFPASISLLYGLMLGCSAFTHLSRGAMPAGAAFCLGALCWLGSAIIGWGSKSKPL